LRQPQCSSAILRLLLIGALVSGSPAQTPSADKTRDPNRQRVRLKLPPDIATAPTSTGTDLRLKSERFEIPDGTPIHFRLAQPVRGITRTLIKYKVYSREGDTVRLVVADDVRVNSMVIIAKGAIGQATVTKVQIPTFVPSGNYQTGSAFELLIPKTGDVSLQLDWVEDVTNEHILLRALPKGESKPFVMSVAAEHGGMVVRPARLKRDLLNALDPMKLSLVRARPWAPTGSRLTAYVDGASSIDPDNVKQAQALLPVPNENGILTIYRTKGQGAAQVRVFCDEKEIATLAEQQYVSIEVTPGKHTCRTGQGKKPAEFTAGPGEQYFLHLRHRSMAGAWELESVSIDEGEDATANAEIVAEASTEPVSH
jgi:hypothetical protein